ncbi:MAG: hypothetical protein LBQ66_00800, partial [Planctomycetaceae bacterium]|nr:hypothetical protein [Planctomycetaceae bacterium]
MPTRLGIQFKLVRFYYAQRRASRPRSCPLPLRGNCVELLQNGKRGYNLPRVMRNFAITVAFDLGCEIKKHRFYDNTKHRFMTTRKHKRIIILQFPTFYNFRQRKKIVHKNCPQNMSKEVV